MTGYCTVGVLLLFSAIIISDGKRFLFPEDEELTPVEDMKRDRREANPESFSDYFKKLQIVQDELTKNASVGEDTIEDVFKRLGFLTDSSELLENHTSSTTENSNATPSALIAENATSLANQTENLGTTEEILDQNTEKQNISINISPNITKEATKPSKNESKTFENGQTTASTKEYLEVANTTPKTFNDSSSATLSLKDTTPTPMQEISTTIQKKETTTTVLQTTSGPTTSKPATTMTTNSPSTEAPKIQPPTVDSKPSQTLNIKSPAVAFKQHNVQIVNTTEKPITTSTPVTTETVKVPTIKSAPENGHALWWGVTKE